jgi:hypothetical protein
VTRIAQEKQREEAALRQVQFVIEEMEQLKESLSAAVSSLFLIALYFWRMSSSMKVPRLRLFQRV